MGDGDFRVQCMGFEILRRFVAVPHDFEAIEGAKDPLVLGNLVLALEALPALNRLQPFTNLQLAQAVGLARTLVDYNADEIPLQRRIRIRRLMVVAT
jgi:hypothetical protein